MQSGRCLRARAQPALVLKDVCITAWAELTQMTWPGSVSSVYTQLLLVAESPYFYSSLTEV